MNVRLWRCRYLAHFLWMKADGRIHCYTCGKVVG